MRGDVISTRKIAKRKYEHIGWNEMNDIFTHRYQRLSSVTYKSEISNLTKI